MSKSMPKRFTNMIFVGLLTGCGVFTRGAQAPQTAIPAQPTAITVQPSEVYFQPEVPTPEILPPVEVGEPEGAALGSFPQWSVVEVRLVGPAASALDDQANPFKVSVEVVFTAPGGSTQVVQAFYDGDGQGGPDGNVWKARFTPDRAGEWRYASASPNALLNGQAGGFSVTAPQGCRAYQPGDLPDFSCLGRLNFTGERYLRFSNGTAWLKGGVDEPEDFLASGNTVGFESQEAAIDYLAAHGVNSIYLLLHNIDGDEQNVWPWAGSSQSEAKANPERFDLAKTARWEQLFTYIQGRGIVLHLVFEDDSSWIGFDRSLYYREMIARFGHHNGLIWNISEEYDENYTPGQVLEFAQMIRDLDPYDHPVTVHHSRSLSFWEPFLGAPQLDLTSFQTDPTPQYAAAAEWVSRVENSGRTIPISFDETGQLQFGQRDLARQIVWSVYLGGANYEIFTELEAGYKDFEAHFDDIHRARSFLEGLPFTEMRPMPELLPDGNGYALADPQEVYAFYLFGGASQTRINLSGVSGSLEFSWFDPRTGQTRPGGTVRGGALRSFAPPSSQDWVLLLGGACLSSRSSRASSFTRTAENGEGKLPLAGWVYFPLVIHC